ncbi:hypothetical protein FOA52_015964 [Chlamydomonas sp. UWO 241]|nr:hypothetical protein FOA52_015964 [Chlamydomonas sp. UWO 241]
MPTAHGEQPEAQDNHDDDDVSTLYVGNLHPNLGHGFLDSISSMFEAVDIGACKIIQKKVTGASYGFLKFSSRESATTALQMLNGKVLMGQELRVHWALPHRHKEGTSYLHHLFVGDLGSDVTEAQLYNSFSCIGQCSDTRIMWDQSTNRSKGYGFVSFYMREDAQAAVEQMNGALIGSRRIRVGWAQHKQEEGNGPADPADIDRSDPHNTNVYTSNIAPETRETDLLTHFSQYGPVDDIKLHKTGGYGFVKFVLHESAVRAIAEQHARTLHARTLKCSWGKNMARRSGGGPTPTFINNSNNSNNVYKAEGAMYAPGAPSSSDADAAIVAAFFAGAGAAMASAGTASYHGVAGMPLGGDAGSGLNLAQLQQQQQQQVLQQQQQQLQAQQMSHQLQQQHQQQQQAQLSHQQAQLLSQQHQQRMAQLFELPHTPPRDGSMVSLPIIDGRSSPLAAGGGGVAGLMAVRLPVSGHMQQQQSSGLHPRPGSGPPNVGAMAQLRGVDPVMALAVQVQMHELMQQMQLAGGGDGNGGVPMDLGSLPTGNVHTSVGPHDPHRHGLAMPPSVPWPVVSTPIGWPVHHGLHQRGPDEAGGVQG